MQNFDELRKKINEMETKSLVAEDMKAFVTLVLSVVNKSKDEMANLSQENLKIIKDSIAFIEVNYQKWDNTLNSKINTATGQFDTKLALLKDLIDKVKTIKPKDGINPNPEDVVPLVMGKIVLPKYKETILDDRQKIVEKINTGQTKDPKIQLTQIESFDKIHTKLSTDLINRAIGIVDQRTSFLINKVSNLRTDVDTLTNSTTTEITGAGTINEIAYFNGTKSITSLPVATYPSLTELSYVKGVTSALQTQLGLKAPLTSPVFVTDITTPLIIGGTAVDSKITYKSTTGAGTVAGIAHQWLGGTNGATVIATMLNNGNIGIGNVAPAGKLDILVGAADATTNPLVIAKGTSNYVTILNNGNVGIGTTGPGSKLDVNSGINSQFLGGISTRGAVNGNTNNYEWGHANSGGYGSTIGYYAAAGNPYIAFNGSAGTTNNTFKTSGIKSSIILSDLAGGMQFGNVGTAATTDNQVFVPLVTILNGGNVGIGQTSPTARLSVLGADSLSTSFAANISGATGTGLVVANNGNVGIGTTVPGLKLDVLTTKSGAYSPTAVSTGGIRIFNDNVVATDNEYSALTLQVRSTASGNNAIGTIALIQPLTAGTAGDFAFTLRDAAGNYNERVRIQSDGNVGIGTTSPTSRLHLAAGTATAGTAPLGFTSGTLLTTPVAGKVEFLTDAYYGTITTGPTRKTFAFLESPTFTTPNIGVATGTSLAVSGKLSSTMSTVTAGIGATTFAITSNVVKVTGDGGGNTIATITGGVSGQELTLIFVDALVTITDTDAATADTVNLSAAFTSSANDTMKLVYDGNKWFEVSRSIN